MISRRRPSPPPRGPRPALAAAILLALCLPALAAPPPASRSPGREAARDAARKMSAGLRLLVRTLERAPAEDATAGGRRGLSGRFAAGTGPGGATATYRAILASGSESEIRSLREAGAVLRGRMGRVVTFEAPLSAAGSLAGLPGIAALDAGRRMEPELNISVPATGGDLVADAVAGFGGTGAGVLVAVVDTGQDVRHRDFRRADKSTRFKSVWNMDPFCGGTPPPGHLGGCYYQEERINKHLRGKKGLRYKDRRALAGHGTHVMGIAAGNGLGTRKGFTPGVYAGMAPEADLIGVKVFDDQGRYVGDLTEALQFLAEEQTRLGDPPMVVNLSLGHQDGAHDGSDPDEVAIDAFVQEGLAQGTPRVVVKSAGNDGGSGIYLTGSLDGPAGGTFTVPALLPSDPSEPCGFFSGRGNDYVLASLWYPGDTTVEVTVSSPGGTASFSNQTGNDPLLSYQDTSRGTLFVDCPPAPYPVNGDRQCVFGVDDTGGVPPATGTWTFSVSRLSGPGGTKFDSWILAGDVGICTATWDAPSPGGTLTIPGTAHEVITAGAWVTRTSWLDFKGKTRQYISSLGAVEGDLAFFSSRGPTRDGRIKPDLTAPGMGIASARSRHVSIRKGTEARLRTVDDKKHYVLEGTSMSAPHVAGAAAQLLSLDPALDAHQILALLAGSATQDGFTGASLPDSTWGAGKLDVFGAAVDHLGPP